MEADADVEEMAEAAHTAAELSVGSSVSVWSESSLKGSRAEAIGDAAMPTSHFRVNVAATAASDH